MREITSRQQTAVDNLVEFWRSGIEPTHALTYVAIVEHDPDGGFAVARFLRDVYWVLSDRGHAGFEYEDERTFKQYLIENVKTIRTREVAWNAKLKAEAKDKASAEFNALGAEMSRTQARDKLLALNRRRAELAPMTGYNFSYENHCWHCKGQISSQINARCPACGWYICGCGACGFHCPSQQK